MYPCKVHHVINECYKQLNNLAQAHNIAISQENQNDPLYAFKLTWIRGIFSDPNIIFLWHESEDINKKSISKISVNSNFQFTSYAWLLIRRLLCWIESGWQEFMWKLLPSCTEMISA